MKSQMKGNKMSIKKKSTPKPPAKRRSPKGGGPFITPGQKNKLDQMTGKAKPLEANIGGILQKTKKMFGNFKKNKKPTMAKNTKAKDNVKTAKNGGVIKANVGKLLETFSPAYSIMKGKGPIANMLGMAKAKPMAGLTKEEKEAKAREQIMANRSGRSNRMTPMTGMKGGGSVKKKKSIDGIATKGKTRAS
jgi:hypothetical protein